MRLTKFVVPEIIFGNGALLEVGRAVIRLGGSRAMVVTDPGVVEAGWTKKVTQCLDAVDVPWSLWSALTPNPKDVEIDSGVQQYLQEHCDCLVAIGGGSVIDAAKAIGAVVVHGTRIHEFEGTDRVGHPLPPLVAIPTTAGTGADVSQFAVIVDTSRRSKMVMISKSFIPDICLSDPTTLMTKSAELTAYTGIDALTHAIEAYVSRAATPLTDGYALRAIRLVATSLRQSVASRSNSGAKESMMMASLQAGIAFSNAVLGAVHAMSHAIGGMLDLPHGLINGVLLPYVTEFNLLACPDRFRDVAETFGERIDHAHPMEAAEKSIRAIQRLCTDIGIPSRLRDLEIPKELIGEYSSRAVQDPCLATNPRDMSHTDLLALFEAAW
ncbi:iron-containing alcohol dehydrogenase [Kyrpidia spormannii]|uniref:1,3-propanediol dehydrogenase n=1 Tax=Kyrpidia spormannii TaxID=2055160 RepID=A0ACA8Z7R6_9BACL|nr:iron-containing alcohol dehydrogenase [Kyrpidia spormannii]CAB3391320.1 1,3-propanediol dehydrogenase [Kyrpidia spormannii]